MHRSQQRTPVPDLQRRGDLHQEPKVVPAGLTDQVLKGIGVHVPVKHDAVQTERLEVVQPPSNAWQIASPVTVRVLKPLRIDPVKHPTPPPALGRNAGASPPRPREHLRRCPGRASGTARRHTKKQFSKELCVQPISPDGICEVVCLFPALASSPTADCCKSQ